MKPEERLRKLNNGENIKDGLLPSVKYHNYTIKFMYENGKYFAFVDKLNIQSSSTNYDNLLTYIRLSIDDIEKPKIEFNEDGSLKWVDKRYLKKSNDYGYYLEGVSMIHYFDNNKNYERSKFR